MCQNESRCMRMPGFYHSKQEPVMVECVKMDTTLIYTQEELKQALPVVEVPQNTIVSRTEFKGVVGSGERLMKKCACGQ